MGAASRLAQQPSRVPRVAGSRGARMDVSGLQASGGCPVKSLQLAGAIDGGPGAGERAVEDETRLRRGRP